MRVVIRAERREVGSPPKPRQVGKEIVDIPVLGAPDRILKEFGALAGRQSWIPSRRRECQDALKEIIRWAFQGGWWQAEPNPTVGRDRHGAGRLKRDEVCSGCVASQLVCVAKPNATRHRSRDAPSQHNEFEVAEVG